MADDQTIKGEGHINLKVVGTISLTVLMALAFYFGGLESRIRATEIKVEQMETNANNINRNLLDLTISINQLKYEIQARHTNGNK